MSLKRMLNFQYVAGDGRGILAQVTGTASGQVLTVDVPAGDPTKYLQKDMKKKTLFMIGKKTFLFAQKSKY